MSAATATVGSITATSTTQASDFQKLTATHATTTSLFVNSPLFNSASIGGTATSTFSSSGALSLAGALTLSGSLNGPLHANAGVVGATTSIGVLYGGTGLTSAPSFGQLLLGDASGGYTLTATSSLGLPTFGYLFPSNATSTLLTFSGGFLSTASTTIGAGTQTTGLTISGGATTTGNAYFAGNVGIGTSSPSTKLDTWGTIRSSNSGSKYIEIGHDSDNPRLTFAGGNGAIFSSSGGVNLLLGNTGNVTVGALFEASKFNVSGNVTIGSNYVSDGNSAPSNGMIIEGNIGIGTTSPYAKLSVVGPVVAEYFHATSSAATSTFTNFVVTGNASTTNLVVSGLNAANCDVKASTAGVLSCGTDSASKWATSTADTLAISLAGGQRVGIGTTTPRWALQIASSTGPQLALSDTSGTSNPWTFRSINGNLYVATASPSTFATSSVTALTINSSGNVGIGTSTPERALDVYTSGNTAVRILGGADGSPWLGFHQAGVEKGYVQYVDNGASADYLDIQSDGHIYLNPTGNVGIGTTTPQSKLHVDGALTLDLDDQEENWLVFQDNRAPAWDIEGGATQFEINETNVATRLIVRQGGNVGIGTTTPEASLDIHRSGSDATLNLNRLGGVDLGIEASDDTAYIGTFSNHPLSFFTNDDNWMLIDTNGNVGIGTTTPNTALTITGQLSIDNIANDNYLLIDGAAGSYSRLQALNAAGSSAKSLILNPVGGAVGIGTTSPWRTFSVDGNVSLKNMTAAQAGSVLCLSADNEVTTDSTPASPCSSSLLANKQNVADLATGLDAVMRLRPVEFDWKEGFGRGHDLGFIAEEVQEAAPILADYNLDGSLSSVKYTQVGALLTKAIQEIASITGTFKSNLTAWLADAANGIRDFYAQFGA